jgi:hypothetical protein
VNMQAMTENDCVFCDLTQFRAADVCIENAFDDEPLADRGGRSAIKVPENRRPNPFRRGSGRAGSFGPPGLSATGR